MTSTLIKGDTDCVGRISFFIECSTKDLMTNFVDRKPTMVLIWLTAAIVLLHTKTH